ncbi:CHAT domain-containing protein [Seohaeicola saemankumensis]|nr:tetratricopeptide repeat protein [Seohaeicola saemankumensis]MCA0873138.1 CHAT domain-containing protein [Seohaeicola saemankumensis]
MKPDFRKITVAAWIAALIGSQAAVASDRADRGEGPSATVHKVASHVVDDPFSLPVEIRPPTEQETARRETLFEAFQAAFQASDWPTALRRAEELLALDSATYGPGHMVAATDRVMIAAVQSAQGAHGDALANRQAAHEIFAGILDPQDSRMARSLMGIATTLRDLNRPDEAIETATQAAEIFRANDLQLFEIRVYRTLILPVAEERLLDDLRVRTLERAVAAATELAGADNPMTEGLRDELSAAMRDLNFSRLLNSVLTLVNLDAFEQALPLSQQGVSMAEDQLPPDNPRHSLALRLHIEVLRGLGRESEAVPTWEKVIALSEQVNGAAHRDTNVAREELARLLLDLGRAEEALPIAEALSGDVASLGQNDVPVSIAVKLLEGDVLAALGRYKDAMLLFRGVSRTARSALGPDHELTLTMELRAAEMSGKSNRVVMALRDVERVLDKAEAAQLPQLYVYAAMVFATYAEDFRPDQQVIDIIEAALSRAEGTDAVPPEQVAILEMAAKIRTAQMIERLETGADLVTEAGTQMAEGDPAAALETYHKAFQQVGLAVGWHGEASLNLIPLLSDAMMAQGDHDKVRDLQVNFLPAIEETFGPLSEQALTARRFEADALLAMHDYVKAAEAFGVLHDRLEAAFDPTSDAVLAAKNNLGFALEKAGNMAEAEIMYRAAYEAGRAANGPDAEATLITQVNLAKVLTWNGQFDLADALLTDALARQQRLLGPDHGDTLITLTAVAALKKAQGHYEAAAAQYRQVADAMARVHGPDAPETLRVRSNLSATLLVLGRPAEAERELRDVLILREAALGRSHPDMLNSLGLLAETMAAQGRRQEALALYRRAHALAVEIHGPDHLVVAKMASTLAGLLTKLGHYDEAQTLLLQSLETRTKMLSPDHPELMGVYNNLALLHSAKGDAATALDYQLRSVGIAETQLGAAHPQTLISQANAAVYERQGGQLKAAHSRLSGVLELSRASLGDGHSSTLLRMRNLAFLSADLQLWDEVMAMTRAILSRPELDITARPSVEDTKEAAAAELSLTGDLFALAAFSAHLRSDGGMDSAVLMDEAFQAVQRGREIGSASALSRSIARRVAARSGAGAIMAELEAAQRRQTHIDVALIDLMARSDLDEDRSLARRQALFEERGELIARFSAARQRLQAEHPDVLHLMNPAPVAIADIRGAGTNGLLGEDEALIVVTPGTEGLVGIVWAITNEGADWALTFQTRTELERKIGTFHNGLSGRGPSRGAMALTEDFSRGFNADLARELYNSLFGAPRIAARIADKQEWIVVPYDGLLSLPFAALVNGMPVTGAPSGALPSADSWLGVQKSISLLPNVAALRSLRAAGRDRAEAEAGPDRARFFGIGDPAFEGAPDGSRALPDASDVFDGGVGRLDSVKRLPRLPGTREEILAMRAAFGSPEDSILMGTDANETRLASLSDSGALRQASVVLFATHGLLAGAFNGLAEPALALSPPQDQARVIGASAAQTTPADLTQADLRIDDGLLTASEAAMLDLDADWVILSACDTAAGDSADAAGLSGLARGFFHAGAKSLLVSHWPVDDRAATEITTTAVRTRIEGRGISSAEAMRRAMERLARAPKGAPEAHPSYWAPFVVVGVPASN